MMLSDTNNICCLSQKRSIIFVHRLKSTFITTYSGTKANFGPISHEFMETILSYCQEKAVGIFSFPSQLSTYSYVISEAFSFLILSVLQFQAVSFLIIRCINHTNTHRDVSPLAFTTQSYKCFMTADGTAATLQCRCSQTHARNQNTKPTK